MGWILAAINEEYKAVFLAMERHRSRAPMTEPPPKKRLPLLDFTIPLIVKFPVVFMSNFVVIGAILITLFYLVRFFGLKSFSVYFGHLAFWLLLGFCIFYALKFNSLIFLRRFLAERNRNLVFFLPHPVVSDIDQTDGTPEKIKKICAIAILESKGYTIAYGLCFLVLYLIYLYYFKYYSPNSLACLRSCEVLLFGIKSIGSGIIFDFFDSFNIEISDIKGVSTLFLLSSFLAKLVFTGIVLRIITLYYSFRRRFRSVLREEALTHDAAQKRLESVRKSHPELLKLAPGSMLVPPWLRSRPQLPTGKG